MKHADYVGLPAGYEWDNRPSPWNGPYAAMVTLYAKHRTLGVPWRHTVDRAIITVKDSVAGAVAKGQRELWAREQRRRKLQGEWAE